jgi:hypothetical protein
MVEKKQKIKIRKPTKHYKKGQKTVDNEVTYTTSTVEIKPMKERRKDKSKTIGKKLRRRASKKKLKKLFGDSTNNYEKKPKAVYDGNQKTTVSTITIKPMKKKDRKKKQVLMVEKEEKEERKEVTIPSVKKIDNYRKDDKLTVEIKNLLHESKGKILSFFSNQGEDKDFFIQLIRKTFLTLKNETKLLYNLSINQLKKIPAMIYDIGKEISSYQGFVFEEKKFLKKIRNLCGFIYVSTNQASSNKKYVGQTTVPIEREWSSIINKALQIKRKREKNPSQPIQARYIFNAIIKYGIGVWDLKLIDIAYSQTELDNKEIYYIKKFMSNALRYKNPTYGYNMNDGGRGGKHAPETKEKIREISTRKWQESKYREKTIKGIKEVWERDGHKEKMSEIFSEAQKEIWERLRNDDPETLKERLEILGRVQEGRIIPIEDIKQFLTDIKNSEKREDLTKYGFGGLTVSRKIKQILGPFGVKNYKQAKSFLDDRSLDEIFSYLDNPEGYSTFKDPAIKEFFIDVDKSETSSDLFDKYGFHNISRVKIPRILGKFRVTNYTELKTFLEKRGVIQSLEYFNELDKKYREEKKVYKSLTKYELLSLIANEKNLVLMSSYDDYKNESSALKWICTVCGNKFEQSAKNIKRVKIPCEECRKTKS